MSSARLGRIPRWAGLTAIGVGATVLVGWAYDIDVLKGAGHRITMKPNAAIGLIACGVSLLARSWRAAWSLHLGGAAAALAAALGALTLTEHIAGWNLGIDQLLFYEPPGAAGTASPARMGINASVSFTLAGVSLVIINRSFKRAAVVAQSLALTVMTLATIAIVGYLYGAHELYNVARYTGIAWPTALTILIIAVGILALRPDAGPVAALNSDGPGGIMARRVLLPAVLVPLTLGYFRVAGQRQGLYDTGLGTALLTVSLVVVLATLIWGTAVRLDETNRRRAAATAERDELLVRERAAREQAEHASRLKDEFLAALSHELRTPLNAILGWTEMLRSNAVAPEKRAHAAEVVARNGATLVRLIEDILDVSRSAAGRLHLQLEPVDLVALAGQAVELLSPDANAKGVRLDARLDGASAMVSGDRQRLQQVVVNLLANGVKFTPPGGVVSLDVRPQPSTVELTVHDSGKGIDPAFLPHLFERFRQEDGTTTREHGGLGLGLSIVRELTELHGGSVRAASDGPGRGSSFTVTLPRLPA